MHWLSMTMSTALVPSLVISSVSAASSRPHGGVPPQWEILPIPRDADAGG
jgi:hypothetical protein